MSTTAASLALPTLNSKSQTLFSSRHALCSSHAISSVSLRLNPKPISISASFLHFDRTSPSFSSHLVPNVAFSSEFYQEEETASEGDEPSNSPDFKLFVGNLPFNIDSAQLAELFESVGDVQLVEVYFVSYFRFGKKNPLREFNC